jgi:cell division protein ZapA (FtsZ GTPase activity inhibitor)
MKLYKVTILGEQYTLVSDQTEEQVLSVAASVDVLMQEIMQATRGVDRKRVAVLAALRLASKVHEMQVSLQDQERNHQRLAELVELASHELS